jgi:hypothetical protein
MSGILRPLKTRIAEHKRTTKTRAMSKSKERNIAGVRIVECDELKKKLFTLKEKNHRKNEDRTDTRSSRLDVDSIWVVLREVVMASGPV